MTIRALDVEGTFRGAFGYDRHLRGFVRGLHERGVAIHLFEDDLDRPMVGRESWQDPFFETLNRPVGARVMLQSRMPHRTTPSMTQSFVNLTTFEASGIPRDWVAFSQRFALTVVNSESSRRAWITSGAPEDRVRICPLGVDTDSYSPSAAPLRLRLSDGRWIEHFRTRFLNVSAIQPRKNLIGLIRTWIRATDADDDAVLVLKLTVYSGMDYQQHLNEIAQTERHLGKTLQQAAPVHITMRTYSDHVMPSLFAAATHYVSLSHGEGWDMPMSEAAATGLRLIAPDHSAYRDYLDASTARMLPSPEIPVLATYSGFTARLFAGQHWWQPDEDAAVAAIRDAINGRDLPAASVRDRMVRDFTWEKATDRMLNLLTQVEHDAPVQRRWTTLQGYIDRTAAKAPARRASVRWLGRR